ncbi:MAG: metalloregulator ArsR/SmtB family transcription factor [archaeon]|nr:metalloregulator ArsR/SmtB family transcription factor [archaeon]
MTGNYPNKHSEGVLNLPPEMEEIVKSKGGLPKIMEHIPSAETYEAQAERFKALSAPVRLQIMHALLVADLCPSIMKKITGMSDSKLSYHLDILESAGFIAHMQSQKWRIYAITLEGRKAIGHLKAESDIPII